MPAPPYTPADLLARLERAAAALGCQVEYWPMPGSRKAILFADCRRVFVESRWPPAGRCYLLAHELAHLLANHTKRDGRAKREVVAEAAAALALARFGLDTHEAANAYIASHGGGLNRYADEARALASALTRLLRSVA
jgi:hypothetical protein